MIDMRPWKPGDTAYVHRTWTASLCDDKFRDKRIAPQVLSWWVGRYVTRLMREPDITIRMAVDGEDEDSLVGYAAYTGDALHYVYVRGGRDTDMRRLGIARDLLKGLDIKTYTTRTWMGEQRLKPKERGWTFEPRQEPATSLVWRGTLILETP